MSGNIVTPNRTPSKGRGRPRKHTSDADRQKAYRRRQLMFQPNAYVQHSQHGQGIIVRCDDDRAMVAFSKPEGRMWLDLSLGALQVTGEASKLPRWADPEIHTTKKRTVQLDSVSRNERGCMPGVRRDEVRIFRKKSKGHSKKYKDWSDHIARTLIRLATNLKENA